tara:strand:+ start:602 stop:2032 length:1431 start_codon:yes stop_codon:yes gene_type:complete
MWDEFLNYVKEVADDFLEVSKSDEFPVKIVGNLDSDGITSVSILMKALSRKDVKFSVSIIEQINEKILEELSRENYEKIFFVDLGSGCLKAISEVLKSKVYVLDHHIPDIIEKKIGNVVHVNPHLFGIDGTKSISAAGVTYFFAKSLDENNIDLAYLGLIGAIGDIQEEMGFKDLNEKILEDALASGEVQVKETFRFYGAYSKPMHKVLEYSTNPYIPGVTGNEKGAIKFIEELGIKLKYGKEYRKISSLSKEEFETLFVAIESSKISDSEDPLIGPVFLLKKENIGSIKKDLREFSTLLNSCGRMNCSSLGVSVCLGDEKMAKKAMDILRDYRKEIIDALNWFYNAKKGERVIEKEGFVIILAEGNIRDKIIGTLASILSKSNIYKQGTVIVSTAYTLEGNIKSSFRICGRVGKTVDLRKVVKDIIASGVGGLGGGHRLAAGGIFPQEKEKEFIDSTISVLENLNKEGFLLEKSA